jgi:hypothetical protein
MGKYSRPRSTPRLPPGPRVPRDGQNPFFEPQIEEITNIDPDKTLLCETFQIANYHPLPNAAGPATAVLLVFPLLEIDYNVLFRLNSKNAMDGLIDSLLRHRREVWGDQ